MAEIAIIGAGHAGIEAAFTCANAGHSVTVWSDEAELPYFRPRLIAVAFGQAEPDGIRIKPSAMYEKAGIVLRHERVTELNLSSRTVQGIPYDGILLAQGSTPFIPPFNGDGVGSIHTLWTMADARALRATLSPGKRLTIIGGGVLGLEAALRATLAGISTTVVEVTQHLLGGVLGDNGEAVLRATLEAKGISLQIGTSIQSIHAHHITLANGSEIAHDTVLCSAGARPQTALAEQAGMVPDYGLCSSETLAIAPKVYVAGDLARPTAARPTCSVRRAMLMGKLAAQNLLAELNQAPALAWEDPRLPLFMKVEDVEFHTLGDTRSPDLREERLDDGSQAHIWQSVLYRGEVPVGIRFVGSRVGFNEWEKKLS